MSVEPLDIVSAPPADLGKRFVAGLIDAGGVAVLLAIAFSIHLKFVGALVPIWTIAGVTIAWNVLPLWRFQATVGLKLMGLKVVTRAGAEPDILEVAVRELIGRGVIALSFLGSFFVGLVSMFAGVGTLNVPAGPAFFLLLVAAVLLKLAVIGQLIMVIRTDRRSLADLLGRVKVVDAQSVSMVSRPPVLPSADRDLEPDEIWLKQAQRRGQQLFVIAEILAVGWAIGFPFLNFVSVRSIDATSHWERTQAEAELQQLTQAFEGNPANVDAADALVDALNWAGQSARAAEVLVKHRAARERANQKKEEMLREQFLRNPDWDTAELLLTLYAEQERVVDGRRVWEKYLEVDDTPETLASFGIWLYREDLNLDAVDYLQRAIDQQMSGGDAHAYLGFALMELGRKAEARRAFLSAVERDPNLTEDLQDNIEVLDRELGPRPRTPKNKTGRRKRRR